MRFLPVKLYDVNGAVGQTDSGQPFEFSPLATTISLKKILPNLNAATSGYNLDLANLPDDCEVYVVK